jgi:hypothetical protein
MTRLLTNPAAVDPRPEPIPAAVVLSRCTAWFGCSSGSWRRRSRHRIERAARVPAASAWTRLWRFGPRTSARSRRPSVDGPGFPALHIERPDRSDHAPPGAVTVVTMVHGDCANGDGDELWVRKERRGWRVLRRTGRRHGWLSGSASSTNAVNGETSDHRRRRRPRSRGRSSTAPRRDARGSASATRLAIGRRS